MILWSKTPCTRTLEAHFYKAARRNFRPVKNLGAQLFRSHQESIISSRELHDRRNTNTSSRSEILTPNSKSSLDSLAAQLGVSKAALYA